MVPLYLKHALIRTRFEQPARRFQRFVKFWKVIRHSGLHDVYAEEREIDRLIEVVVRPHSNCIDVGAHIGSALSTILRRAYAGKHIAIEPVTQKAAWLRHKFPEVDIHEIALLDNPGRQRFVEDMSYSGYSRVVPSGPQLKGEITVRCDCLDNIVPPNRRVHFLKIDIEGAELLALRGASSLLHRDHPAILFESVPCGAEKFGLTHDHLYRFLTNEMGYSIYLIRDFLNGGPSLDQSTFDKCHVYPFRAFNYIAVI